MKALEQLQAKIEDMVELLGRLKAENRSLRDENQGLTSLAAEQRELLEKELNGLKERVLLLEEEKKELLTEIRGDQSSSDQYLRANERLEKSREMAKMKVEEMLSQLQRVTREG